MCGSPMWRAYAIRPYSFWLIAWGGWCGWFVWFAHVRAYAIRPYSFWLITWGGAVLIFGLRGDFVSVFFFLFEGGLVGGLLFELDSDVVDEFVDVIDEGFVRGGVVGDGYVAVDEGGPCFVGAVGGAASLFQGAFFGESPFAAADYGHGEYGIVVDADVAEHFLEPQVVEC